MGIDLGEVLVRRETSLSEYAGKTLAFDAWNVLYQFLASIRQPDGTPLMDREGHVTSHLAGALYRTANLVEAGIQPVFVFDGEPHPLKKATLALRAARKEKAASEQEALRPALEAAEAALEAAATEEERVSATAALREAQSQSKTKAQQTSRLTAPMVVEAKQLLGALGIPVMQAPGEGEATGAVMARKGLVHAVVSQDFDAMLFGAPRLVRSLAVGGKRKLPGKQVWVDAKPEEIDAAASLELLGLTLEQLLDVALLVGTDFHPGIKGIGAKKAVAVIQKEGGLEALLERLGAQDDKAAAKRSALERAVVEQSAALADRAEVRRIFLQPTASSEPPPSPGRVDASAVMSIMVERHGFAKDRVETALERYKGAAAKGRQQTLF